MRYRYSIFTVCGIVAAALSCWLLNVHRAPQEADISGLTDAGIHVVGLPEEGRDDAYADLDFLVRELSGKSVVVLGEALHYDGSTFLMKTRLVKFLHERMGFNTLLFEGGMYDLHLLQKQLETDPDNADPEASLWFFWTISDQIGPLWDYIRRERGLRIGGIDCQYSGNVPDSVRHAALEEICRGAGIDLAADFPAFNALMPHISRTLAGRSYLRYRFGRDSLAVLDEELLALAGLLGRHDEYLGRYIDGIRNLLLYSWEYNAADSARTVWRDSLMADNLMLHRASRPGDKVIVWTSNMHASKAGALNYRNPGLPVRNLGSRLHSYYGDSLYVVLFHNWARESWYGHVLSRLKRSSAEYAVHKYVYPRSGGRFLFFSEPEEFGEVMCSGIMEGEFVCSPGDMCDALIYEDTVSLVKFSNDDDGPQE